MFERLTVPARKAIAEAKQAARSQDHDGIAPGHLLLGLMRTEGSVAGQLLRDRVEISTVEAAISHLPLRGTPEDPGVASGGFSEELRMMLAGAVGAAAAQGQRCVGTANCLLSLLVLQSPSLLALLDALGVDADELAAAARTADPSSEVDAAAPASNGEAGWTVTVGSTDPAVAWSDEED